MMVLGVGGHCYAVKYGVHRTELFGFSCTW
jgi:hypothetical protein